MKYKSGGLVMLIIAMAGIAFGALAERQSTGRSFLLRTGSASAELFISEGTKFSLGGTSISSLGTTSFSSQTLWETNGALLKIISGTNAISVRADEILSAPYTLGARAEKQTSGKRALLLLEGVAPVELHVYDGNKMEVESTGNTRLAGLAIDGRIKQATGGVLLEITSGTNSISIQADKVLFDP